MFNVGDLIIYSAHGICKIDDICEKTYSGITKTYYVLHPVNNAKLEINAPINNPSISMLEIMSAKEAEDILNVFTLPGVDWIEKSQQRTQVYSNIAKTGDRKDISKVIHTMMKKKFNLETSNKKFSEYDKKLLLSMQNILFAELAIALQTTIDKIEEKVINLLGIDQEAYIANY